MDLFGLLLVKLIPLYTMIGLGYVAGKKLHVARESIGVIVIYLLVPIVMFSGVMKADLTPATISLPLLSFALSFILCFLFLFISRRIWNDATPNILACAAATGNTGYFGLPVAIALFDEQAVALYIILILGITVFEGSIGMYIAAKGRYSAREAFYKVARIPTIYAFLLGLSFKFFNVEMPDIFWEFLVNIRGAYIVLGMMIIGLGLAALQRFEMDWKFTSVAFVAKFLVWPLLVLAFIWIDAHYLFIYETSAHKALILLSIVPMAANAVVIATLFNTHPEKAATAVLLSTILAIFYVPYMASHLLH